MLKRKEEEGATALVRACLPLPTAGRQNRSSFRKQAGAHRVCSRQSPLPTARQTTFPFPSHPPQQNARATQGATRPQNTLRVRMNHSNPHTRTARHRPRAPRLARKRRRHPAALAANARLVTRLPVARLTLRQRHAILRAESHSLLRNSAALRPARRCHLTSCDTVARLASRW